MCQLTSIQEQVRQIMEGESLVVNLPDVAKLLGISRGSAYSLANQKVIPTLRLGRRIVVPKAALLRMLENPGKAGMP